MSLRPQTLPKRPTTPFERIGGREPVAGLVMRFYDLMDSDPTFAELRAIHGPDLGEMKEKLTDFLVAWMGGPRDWFDKNPGACIMSAHAAMKGIDTQTADQWMACMERAAEDIAATDPDLATSMLASMRSMGRTMARRAGQPPESYVGKL